MNIKFKLFFKPLLLLALSFTSCQNDDLEDSQLEANAFSEFKLSRASGDRIYNFTIGSGDGANVSDLIITNKIEPNENIESIFLISEAVTLQESIVENEAPIEVIRHQILLTVPDIESVRTFNFDMGTRTTYRIWNIRNRGTLSGLPTGDGQQSNFLVENIDGNDFAITSLGEAITVNLIPLIEDNTQSFPEMEDQGDVIPLGQPSAPETGFTFTFDQDVDFTFGEGMNATTFSNAETTIEALVTVGEEPAEPSDAALRVDFTPSNVINEDGSDAGFFFGGAVLDITELGSSSIDFSGSNKSITLNVFSNIAFNIRIQISNAEGEAGDRTNVTSPPPGFKDGAHTGSGWEQITIDFNDNVTTVFGVDGIAGGNPQNEALDGIYNRLQLQFEALPTGLTSRVYIDNINYLTVEN